MKHKQPFSYQNVVRVSLLVIVVLSLLAGYYHSVLQAERKKYLRLEDKYVRVRSELGREETQKLIDQSYKD